MPQVSVIVLTYNPDPIKLRQTLYAIAHQNGVTLEVIISDDGSVRKDFSYLPSFLEAIGIKEHILLEHETNQGTVKSALSAIKAASGEYVFLTSPGDFLFDSTVLADFYHYAKDNHLNLCFGNAVFYRPDGTLSRQCGIPATPSIYCKNVPARHMKTAFFGGEWVVGASYFRKRELALQSISFISDKATYMEDTPSTLFSLAAGEQLCYFNRNIIWYEDGTGISTGAAEKWKRLLNKDLQNCLMQLKKDFPRDPYVDFAYCNAMEPSRWKRLIYKGLSHPAICLRLFFLRRKAPTPIHCSDKDIHHLLQLLETR